MQDRELYQQILGLKSPWSTSEVSLDLKLQQVDVFLSTHPGHRFAVRNMHSRWRVTTILRHANGGIWTAVSSGRSCTQVFPVLIVLNMV